MSLSFYYVCVQVSTALGHILIGDDPDRRATLPTPVTARASIFSRRGGGLLFRRPFWIVDTPARAPPPPPRARAGRRARSLRSRSSSRDNAW